MSKKFKSTLMVSRIKFSSLIVVLVFLGSLLSFSGHASEVNPYSAEKKLMHEVAKQIRQYKSWQILDAKSEKQGETIRAFKFKLLHSNNGKVRMIVIDPNNPNLRKLE